MKEHNQDGHPPGYDRVATVKESEDEQNQCEEILEKQPNKP